MIKICKFVSMEVAGNDLIAVVRSLYSLHTNLQFKNIYIDFYDSTRYEFHFGD